MSPAPEGGTWRPHLRETLGRPLPTLPPSDRWLLRGLLMVFGPLMTVEKPAALTTPRPVIFAFNHTTFYETVLAALMLDFHRQARVGFLVDWMYGLFPLLRWLVAKGDPVYVWNKRSQFGWINRRKGPVPHEQAWQAAAQRLIQGRALAIFPEGKAHRDLRLRRGRHGLGHMALAASATVISVGIDFPARARHGRVPRFGCLLFRVGEPLRFPEESLVYRESRDPRLRQRLAERVTHRVMLELGRLANRPYTFAHPEGSGEC